MHTRRVPERLWLAGCLAVATGLLLVGGGEGAAGGAPPASGAASWRGFVDGERSAVAVGQRMIVVLRHPSLAERVAEAGGQATESEMRQWTASSLAGQKQIAAKLSREGIRLVPDFVYTRTFNGFAAPIDARALTLLERDKDVLGVYPVRAGYPSSLSSRSLPSRAFASGGGRTPEVRTPGYDGAGITIALLDTGVDATHAYLRERVADGIDILDPEGRALARPHPDEPSRIERHGTQLAGLLVGRGGPGGVRGAAAGATVLPIRIAGWQPDARGGFAIYGRTDQLLAGLERAVDPNSDGSALDAARVAVIGVTEPFASFPDGPLARAIEGAARLDTLVVVPAGNEGPAGPGYGSVGGPGGAPAALTVAAADLREETATVRVVLRTGLRVLLDREVPLGGAASPVTPLSLTVVRPRRDVGTGPRSAPLGRYFDEAGFSVVAGKATLLARAQGLPDSVREAAAAGTAAILVDGLVPAGALGVDDRIDVPVVGLPPAAAAAVRTALARGAAVRLSLGASGWEANTTRARLAPFSSYGLAFGGGIKPDLAAAGVELVTSDPGRNEDRTARYGSISGTSASAALVGGAAAVLAQMRPNLDARALKGALVGTAAPLGEAAPASRGAGMVDAAAASAAEAVAQPVAVSFGLADKAGWSTKRRVTLTNVSTRRIDVDVIAEAEGIAGVSVTAQPPRIRLRPGQRGNVVLTARVAFLPRGVAVIEGRARLLVSGGGRAVVPWAVALPSDRVPLLADVRLSVRSFRASDRAPAVLILRAGQVHDLAGRRELRPLSRLDVQLWRAGKQMGLLARLRDVLPGRYAFGITGRGPRGGALARGEYSLRVVATPPVGRQDRVTIGFRIR